MKMNMFNRSKLNYEAAVGQQTILQMNSSTSPKGKAEGRYRMCLYSAQAPQNRLKLVSCLRY